MSLKIQKASLVVILFLLFLFVPLTAYGIFLNVSEKENNVQKENKNKDVFFDGKLWFYDEKGMLLGTYTCEHTYCDYGSSYENDKAYAIDYYKSDETVYLPIIKDQYVFIKDTESEESHEVFLHDIKNNRSFKTNSYSSVKNYQIGLQNNLFIVENKNHMFGVLEVDPLPVLKLSATYDFIGIPSSQLENDKILTDYFIGLRNNEWMIVATNEAKLTSSIKEEIVTFTGEHVITRDTNENYHIRNYQNTKILEEDYKNLFFVDRYLACVTETTFYIYDLKDNITLSETHEISSTDNVEAKLNEQNEIVITINDKEIEKISI